MSQQDDAAAQAALQAAQTNLQAALDASKSTIPWGYIIAGMAGLLVGGGAIYALTKVDKIDDWADKMQGRMNYLGPVVHSGKFLVATPDGPVLSHPCTGKNCKSPLHGRFHTLKQHARHAR